MHAKGWGAYGTLTVTNDITRYTTAEIFSAVGKKTEMLARFSTVAGELGAADHERDVRGFALKFYTGQGNWDLVGNNTPVFFVRDPYKFPDFIHTQKRHPKTNLRSPTAMWDFWSLSPESLHQVTILFSDRGMPHSPRFMHGFGSHTFSFFNDAGDHHWVKFHFKTQQVIEFHTNREAEAIVGRTRESYQADLFGAIEAGDFPKWTMYVQVMPEADVGKHWYNPFDLTKVWPHADYPLIEVGVMELNRKPDNYFQEIEHAAFSPSNVVPGIGFSPDKMLQARVFSYADAHRYRLGTHYEMLPVNRPICPVAHYHKDGPMRFFPQETGATDAYYEPNSFGGAKRGQALRRAAAEALRRRRPLQPSRRQRRLQAGGRPVPPHAAGCAGAPHGQHRRGHAGRAGGDRRAPDRPFLQGRSGLRARRRAAHRTEHRQTRSRGGGVGGEATGAGRNAPAAHSILTTKVGTR